MHIHCLSSCCNKVKHSSDEESSSESNDAWCFSQNSSETEATTPRSPSIDYIESLRHDEVDQQQQLNGYRPMRVAAVQTAVGFRATSGGFRGNYATLFALSEYGHTAMQFCWAYKKEIDSVIANLKAEKKFSKETFMWGSTYMLDKDLKKVKTTWWRFTDAHGILCIALDANIGATTLPSKIQEEDAVIYIETGKAPTRIRPYIDWITFHLIEFGPTHIIFNDALTNVVTSKAPAFREKVARVGVIHSLEQLPTGPYSGGMSTGTSTAAELPLLAELDGLVAVSNAVKIYTKQHCGLDTEMIPNHVSLYKDEGTGGWPRYRQNFTKQNVVMINPALVKGYEIFLGMAMANQQRVHENRDKLLNRPVYNYVAYLSWGSTSEMAKELEAAGVKILQPVSNVESIFDTASVLIVPSLWQEAWGLVATEAQLRGIPVIASDTGGLAEAKRYVGPLISVNKIDGTKRNADGSYIVPPQNIKPWLQELDELLTDSDRYEARSHMAYYTTQKWVQSFDVRGMEKYLLSLMK